MKEKIFLIGGVIAFVIILVWASNAMKNPGINDLEDYNESLQTENQTSDTNENLESQESKVVYANESTFEAEVLNSEKTVLVDFYADWCYPCRMLAPTLEKIARENDDIKVVKVNVDENEKLAVEYGAVAIPLMVIIENGQERDRMSGAVPESEIMQVLKAQ